ncbi:hypothetical protein SAY87_023238 [Trapa incisa]|uniref:ER membrane protein complex subunit 1 n=1 Tax=Trapa incisa TaxID=236973 RepID=A0AAN7K5N7_9MYRT|nr:hypothetical protein SAY87_023238 [Trapa incisa]
MAARVLSLYLLLFLSTAQLGVSLYEDQVGLLVSVFIHDRFPITMQWMKIHLLLLLADASLARMPLASAYSRPEVVAKSQSYFFTHSVKAITVTVTAKSITWKQLLIGTISDQVLALDKRYLDPRRSLNPSQAEKEEGVIPLTDSLPIVPQVQGNDQNHTKESRHSSVFTGIVFLGQQLSVDEIQEKKGFRAFLIVVAMQCKDPPWYSPFSFFLGSK